MSLRCLVVLGMMWMAGAASASAADKPADLMAQFRDPPREFSVMPFWFWNDDLKDEEIVRQIADFEAHGVYGFVIHPRVGLPKEIGWMSERMLHCVRLAVDEAARRRMYVILYDEGMYPSGSSSGQVVEKNPQHRCRGLAKIDLAEGEEPKLEPGWNLIAIVNRKGGQRVAVADRPVPSTIRGIHYIGEGPKEERPPAGDILNPEAVASFVHLVYDKYAEAVGPHLGKTVLGIFTDEPGMLGRGGPKDVLPGTTGIVKEAGRILGYDLTPHLAALWYSDEPDAAKYRADYHRACARRLDETYYRQLSEWCRAHGVSLVGHPAGPDEIGTERFFQVPGQDLVWRYVEPDKPSALEGGQSTQAKCTSGAMLHLGRRRNSNELYGAYGHNLTYDEMKWLADWCFVRGVNQLFPHAFYYSIRGPRLDERPPDVGPHAQWWDRYKPYADYCRRLSWLNTDSQPVAAVAILGESDRLTWAAARVCFENQRDFSYLELRHLWEDAKADGDGVRLAGMHYRAIVADGLPKIPAEARPALEKLVRAGRVIVYGKQSQELKLEGAAAARTPEELVVAIDRLAPPDVTVTPAAPGLRYRHVVKGGEHFYILFNEGAQAVSAQLKVAAEGKWAWLDALTGESADAPSAKELALRPHELKVLRVTGAP